VGDEIDFAAEGLLDGLDGPARDARMKLLRLLVDEGYEREELKEAARYDLLPMLLAETAVGGRARYTLAEVSERSQMSTEFLSAVRRAHGMPIPEPGARAFNDGDLESACHAKEFRDKGLSEEQMLATTRVLGRGLAQAAEVMRSIVLEIALQPGADELELAQRYRAVVEELIPMTTPLLEGMMRLQLRNVVRT
jgi:adenylate cyclase